VLLIDGGAVATSDLAVTLNFIPNENTDAFDDIVEVKLANSVDGLGSAPWQPFKQDIAWNLPAATMPGDVAMVYARYKDDGGNESTGTDSVGIIYLAGFDHKNYLPIVMSK